MNDFTSPELPFPLQAIDITDLVSIDPQDLILNPAQLAVDTLAAGRAIVYARSGDHTLYDDIAFRTFAASPKKGPSPLQTTTRSAMQRDQSSHHHKSNPMLNEILNQAPKLRHRPLAFPKDAESSRYEFNRDTIDLYSSRTDPAGRKFEDRWTFSLTDPPELLLLDASDRDVPMILAQQTQVDLEGTHWLPFPVLLADGCFGRFQDIRSRLVRKTHSGSFYCFLSHRWLDPEHPDPDALQAQFAAWQLIAYLAEAVRIADRRGLHQARRFSLQIGTALGPRGSELAESLIVNLLRSSLDTETLRHAVAETVPIETLLQDYGVAKASDDPGLKELNHLLVNCLVLRTLTKSIYIWYDYSCLPQPPRNEADEDLFAKGLDELSAAQIIGRTAIMLDDADDYLSRAWCTLEAIVADTFGGATDLLVGSARPSAAEGEVEHYFETLLEDRPHMVWRAILDTEIFGIQSSETCMERLGLNITDPGDLPFIYNRLCAIGAPLKTHIDDSEIVTGVIPLPAFDDGAIAVYARHPGRSWFPDAEPPPTSTLNWTDALSLGKAWQRTEDLIAVIPSFCSLPSADTPDTPSCHVSVAGASEGEAILLASWVRHNKAEFETLFSVSVTGISWVASDIAPVGHVATGTLQALPVTTDTLAVVANSTRLRRCKVTGFITESLKWAGVPHFTIAIDISENNVEFPQLAKPPEGFDLEEFIVSINLAENPPKTHPGGLFPWQIQEYLL